MSSREKYAPGDAAGAEVRKEGETWTCGNLIQIVALDRWQS